MKKIVIMSDNHGCYQHVDRILEDNKDADLFIHCGDHEGYDEQLDKFIAVRGNNDWTSSLENIQIVEFENYRIAVCHGHQFGYYNKEEHMIEFCQDNEVDILFTGHTHMPMDIEREGIRMVNPGSTALPRGGYPATYAIMTLDGGKIDVEFIEME